MIFSGAQRVLVYFEVRMYDTSTTQQQVLLLDVQEYAVRITLLKYEQQNPYGFGRTKQAREAHLFWKLLLLRRWRGPEQP